MPNGRYCIYLRKSRADLEAEAHGEGETLARHRNALTEYAKRNGIPIEEIYEEIVSGETIAARPQMQRLLSEVGSGRWDGVLVMEIERLARGDTMDQGLVAQAFKYSGTKIVTPIKTYDPTNEFDEEYFEFGLFMARREFTMTNRRLVRGREASAKEGKYLGSIAPFGYKKVKLENEKGFSLEIVEEQAKIVRMIFDWYANGTEVNGNKKRLGFHAIAVRLNELGIKSLGGKEYWTLYGIKNMLTNPVYIGKIRWGYRKAKKIVTPEGKKKIRDKAAPGEYMLVDGLHKAIISYEMFEKVQEMISENTPAPIKYNSQCVNPFAGILFCAKCNHPISLRKLSSRQKYDYMGCNTAGCSNRAAPFPLIEQRFLNILNSWIKEYDISKEDIEREEKQSAELSAALEIQKNKIIALNKQLDNVYSFFERELYTEDVFRQRLSSLNLEIDETEERIKKIQSEHELALNRQKIQKEFAPAISRLLEIYDTLTPGEKNEWLKLIVDRAYYEKDANGRLHGVSPDQFTLDVYPRLPKKGS